MDHAAASPERSAAVFAHSLSQPLPANLPHAPQLSTHPNHPAIAALDAGRGHKYFCLHVASSGGVALDYPPPQAILEGRFGPRPLAGSRWITSAGARDPEPERDGIPGMQRTAAWLKEQGAEVLFAIEDPKFGHGALVLNKANVRRLLDEFERLKAPGI